MNPTKEEVERYLDSRPLIAPSSVFLGKVAQAYVRLLDENEAIKSANESVAVCAEHTVEIVEFEGCVICENERQAAVVAKDREAMKRVMDEMVAADVPGWPNILRERLEEGSSG